MSEFPGFFKKKSHIFNSVRGISIGGLFILAKCGCPSMKEVLYISLMGCSSVLGAIDFVRSWGFCDGGWEVQR